jgi:hypothetical protein
MKRISDEILGERAKMRWKDPYLERHVRDRIDRYKARNNDSKVAEYIHKILKRPSLRSDPKLRTK